MSNANELVSLFISYIGSLLDNILSNETSMILIGLFICFVIFVIVLGILKKVKGRR